jgi:hypothetical protein
MAMREDRRLEFECEGCSRMFDGDLVDISRAYERVGREEGIEGPSIYVEHAESVANFCSVACRASTRLSVYQGAGFKIPATPPGFGPVESCAKCGGPVAMWAFHLAYSEGVARQTPYGFDVQKHATVAVLCQRCAPLPKRAASSALQSNG